MTFEITLSERTMKTIAIIGGILFAVFIAAVFLFGDLKGQMLAW